MSRSYIERIQSSQNASREEDGLIFTRFSALAASRSVGLEAFSKTLTEFYRVADTSLDRYELYIGEDQAPDFTAAPAQTNATLPFNKAITPPLADTKVLHVVVRKRNRYNLASFNQWEYLFEIDTNGDEVFGPLTAPTGVVGYAQTGGMVLVIAAYTFLDRDPADTWKVWISEGVDPVPAVDTPAYDEDFSAVALTSNTYLQKALGPYTTGSTLHIIVGVERSDDTFRALAPVFQVELPALINVAEDDADLFGGASYDSLQ